MDFCTDLWYTVVEDGPIPCRRERPMTAVSVKWPYPIRTETVRRRYDGLNRRTRYGADLTAETTFS
ncbi:MAG: hypothetical protein IKV66_14250 [Clostridia bacterium]|nr:hypothetical protein [Clostridia bacterium]